MKKCLAVVALGALFLFHVPGFAAIASQSLARIAKSLPTVLTPPAVTESGPETQAPGKIVRRGAPRTRHSHEHTHTNYRHSHTHRDNHHSDPLPQQSLARIKSLLAALSTPVVTESESEPEPQALRRLGRRGVPPASHSHDHSHPVFEHSHDHRVDHHFDPTASPSQ